MSSHLDESGGPAAIMFRRGWWAMALRGIVAILLGVMVLMRPVRTFSVFVALIAFYLTVDGVLTLGSAFRAASGERRWWPYWIEGSVSLGIGLIGLARPASLGIIVLGLFAIRAIVVGLIEMGTAVSVSRNKGGSAWSLGLAGAASLLFGVLFLARPGFVFLAGAWMFGIYALAFGVLLEIGAAGSHSSGGRLTAVHQGH